MKKFRLTLLLLMAMHLSFAQSSSINWIATDGSQADDFGTSVTCDDNYVYTTGVFADTCFMGDTTLISKGVLDVYISKYDKEGSFIWVKQFGGNEYDRCGSIMYNSGHIYTTGFFEDIVVFEGTILVSKGRYDIFVADQNTDGTLNWIKQFGGAGRDQGHTITTDSEDNIYLSGFFQDTVAFDETTLISKGEYDIYVVKMDDAGNILWVNQAGGVGEDFGTSISTDFSDNVYLTGSFEDTATFADTTISSLGYQDIFLVKYSSTGEQLWLKTAGGDWGASASSVTINNSGQLYLAGVFGGTTFFGVDSIISNGMRDVFLARYDLSGTLQWIDSWGSDEHDYSSDLVTDNEFVYLSYSFSGETTINDTILADRSAQIIQLSNSGEVLDFIQLGDYYRNKCTIDNNSALFVTGAVGYEPNLFGDTIMNSSSFAYDIFLTKIDYKHTGIIDPFAQTSPLLIYPNPAKDFITIEIEDETVVLITNINGQFFGQYEFNKGFKNRKINVADFPPGLYIIIVQTASKTQTAKFIRQ